MNTIKFRGYKKITNDELIRKIYNQMDKTQKMYFKDNDNDYWREATILNSLIIEAKKRNLQVDNKVLLNKILF